MYFFIGGTLALISFILGVYLDNLLKFKINISKFIIYLYEKLKRFVKHVISLSGIYIILIISYYVFEKFFGYGQQILSNLISAGLSVIFIDFLIKERDLKDRKKVNILIKTKILNIGEKIQKIILQFSNLSGVGKQTISNEVIRNILEKDELIKEVIDYIEFTKDGQATELKLNKFDYIYYVAKEIEPDVSMLIQNFNQFLENDEMISLIKLRDLLDKNKIFKVRYSSYKNITGEEYEFYKELLIDVIIQLNDVIIVLNKEYK